MLWMGTLDGMNLYFGDRVERPAMLEINSFEGYLIEHITETQPADMWVQTTYGLHKVDRLTAEVVTFQQFNGLYMLRNAGPDRVAVFDTKNQLHLYNPDTQDFEPVEFQIVEGEEILDMGGTESFFWTAGNKGVYRYDLTDSGTGEVRPEYAVCLMDTPVKYSKVTDHPEIIYIIDHQNRLYRLDIRQNEKTFILSLGDEMDLRGIPSGITENNGSYFISFKVGGVLKYVYHPGKRIWKSTDLGIKTGVFDMVKDKLQDVMWIATDGQGLFAYWEGSYNIRSHRFSDFSYDPGRPVRALFIDDKEWLWIGTKGEGLVGINRSDEKRELYECEQRHLTVLNSTLEDNSVYALSPSNHGGFWVGSEGGLNFYQYANRSLQKVSAGQEIEYVHAIREVGDSVLWIATVGEGVFKATISKRGNSMYLEQIRRFEVEEGNFSSNYFFAMHYTAGGDLWLGNRGNGVFRMYPYGLEPTAWPGKHSPLQNDVFALFEYNDILWVGTSSGLVGLGGDGKEYFIDKGDGLPNNIIRSIQAGNDGGLWVATNSGIARVDSSLNEIKSYSRKDGLLVTEFSDGAALASGDALYFGGMDGWIEIRKNETYKPAEAYVPPLYFIALQKKDKIVSLHTGDRQQQKTVKLANDENTFTLTFMAVDYMNQGDYQYLYKADAQDNEDGWIDNGAMNTLSLTQLAPGYHTLQLKYRSYTTGIESRPVSVEMYVRPLWWQTPFMKFVYWLLIGASVTSVVVSRYRKSKRRHAYELEHLEQQHKEELYEEKLRFFTNITHEFSTPLTLIYSPCERILAYEGTDDFVRKYVVLIKKHTERLYRLIQEIIDYRRIETRHQQLNPERFNLSGIMLESCEIFIDLAEKNGITLIQEIEEEVYWNTDRRSFPKIVTNLLSNALKYTPGGGTVKVCLTKLSDDEVQIKVYNTGKGIREEDRQRIFNRYSVLDDVEEKASSALTRNGLGMAICHSSVLLLGGKIEINSEVGQYAEFIVTLPLIPLPEGASETPINDVMPLAQQNWEVARQMLAKPVEEQAADNIPESGDSGLFPEDRPMVLVVDDNNDILFLLREMLSHSYHVKAARNADEALELLRTATPNLIITDVMMPGTDGMLLTRQIKQNKHTMHIPLIILSARNTDEAKTEGIQAGADAYIGKPFNAQYLQAVVSRLIESRKDMKEYYNTAASAFEFIEGQLVKREDKDFIYQLNEVVEKNLSDSSFNTETIAEALNISSRSLYRRLKELNLPAPKDFIKERKMEKVVKLLLTSDMSVQEIIFECGFNNRAHFYREFTARHGMTPKEFRNRKKNPDASLGKE